MGSLRAFERRIARPSLVKNYNMIQLDDQFHIDDEYLTGFQLKNPIGFQLDSKWISIRFVKWNLVGQLDSN